MCNTAIAVTSRQTLGFTGLARNWACHQLSTHTTLNNATPQFAERQCPLVCNRQPGWLGDTCVYQLAAVCLHDGNGALTTKDGRLWQGHATHTQPYIIGLLAKIS